MKKILFWIICLSTIIFWPISLFLANPDSWPTFFLAGAVLGLDWFLYLKKIKFHSFLYLLLPLIHPAYLGFPVIALLLNYKDLSTSLFKLIAYLSILVCVFFVSVNSFFAFSIFTFDPLQNDTLIKKISLIPNRTLARVYQNKTTVPLEKFKSNSFLSLDINNYFFALHPRELVGDNQNLNKYPYPAIILFLLGLFFLPENKHNRWLVLIFFSTIISLALINNQDKFDFLIFTPVSLLCYYGLRKIQNSSRAFYIFSLFYFPLTLFELAKILFLI